MKKFNLIIVLAALLFLLCSCTASNGSSSKPAASSAVAEATSSTSQSAAASTSQDSSKAAQWPDEFKGKLPTPVCKITDVTRYDEKSMSGKLTIVTFTDMSKEDAQKFVQGLKDLGFKDGVDLDSNEKIVFSGVNQDQTAQNGVNFMYSVTDKSGSIAY